MTSLAFCMRLAGLEINIGTKNSLVRVLDINYACFNTFNVRSLYSTEN